jgi:hypothetical protein
MSDLQRGVTLFQPQPAGLGLFLRPAALSIAYVEQLHCALSALLDPKIAPAVVDMKDQQALGLFSNKCRYSIERLTKVVFAGGN